MVIHKRTRRIMAIIMLVITVSLYTSTIELNGNNLNTAIDIDPGYNGYNGNSNANGTTVITNTEGFQTVVDSQNLFDLKNIPAFMMDYFEWHGQQLQQMNKDAKESEIDGNDDYLSKYRFLVLRCAKGKRNGKEDFVEDRCGGLSDRLKSFPLFLWYAATTNRILFIRWGRNRPAPIETFMVPGNFWNWTFPDALLRKIEKLEGSDDIDKNHDENNFTRLYFDGLENQHKQMVKRVGERGVWMIEGNDYTGGSSRYKTFVESAIENASKSISDQNVSNKSNNNLLFASMLIPSDAFYENFYHDLFHATFRPSFGVQKALNAFFYDSNTAKNIEKGKERKLESWLPVPLQRNRYVVAHYRANYPREPYRKSRNRTILLETTIHAVECAKSRVRGPKVLTDSRNMSSTSTRAQEASAIYVASDTALVFEAVRDVYHNDKTKITQKDTDPLDFINVWTYLDLLSYDMVKKNNSDDDGDNKLPTKPTVSLAEDPPHLNFAQPDDVSAFYTIFVDLFLMSYSNCVVYGAGGFGIFGSLVSYRPWCGMPYSVNHGTLKHCSAYG